LFKGEFPKIVKHKLLWNKWQLLLFMEYGVKSRRWKLYGVTMWVSREENALASHLNCLLLIILQYKCNVVHVYVRGYAAAQLVEGLRYKSEGRGFDPRCCHWNFSLA
jgi:hypothetical protein